MSNIGNTDIAGNVLGIGDEVVLSYSTNKALVAGIINGFRKSSKRNQKYKDVRVNVGHTSIWCESERQVRLIKKATTPNNILLVTWDDWWADEIQIKGHCVVTQADFHKTINELNEFVDGTNEWGMYVYIGSNEEVYVQGKTFSKRLISDDEIRILEETVGLSSDPNVFRSLQQILSEHKKEEGEDDE
jgi:hypothetical protein